MARLDEQGDRGNREPDHRASGIGAEYRDQEADEQHQKAEPHPATLGVNCR